MVINKLDALYLPWVGGSQPKADGSQVLDTQRDPLLDAPGPASNTRPAPTRPFYLRCHTFIMSSEPCERTPLSDRISSVASSVACRGRIIVSP